MWPDQIRCSKFSAQQYYNLTDETVRVTKSATFNRRWNTFAGSVLLLCFRSTIFQSGITIQPKLRFVGWWPGGILIEPTKILKQSARYLIRHHGEDCCASNIEKVVKVLSASGCQRYRFIVPSRQLGLWIRAVVTLPCSDSHVGLFSRLLALWATSSDKSGWYLSSFECFSREPESLQRPCQHYVEVFVEVGITPW